jgi:CDP-diacylglycerol--glycerol-3-phosphate 3-phosphatidyltransferase
MSNMDRARKAFAGNFTSPMARLLARTPLTPNALTWLGFLVTIGSAVLVVNRLFLAAGIVLLVAGLFDLLDGALARLTGRVTQFGAVLDSTLDRLSEAAVLLGLLWVSADNGLTGMNLLIGLALVGSLMVSYLRARIEGLGIECREGLFTRPERVIIMALGLMLARFDYVLLVALALIAFFSFVTVAQRLIVAWRKTRA